MKHQQLLKLCIDYCYTLSQDDSGTSEFFTDTLDVSEDELVKLFKELNTIHKLGLIKKENGVWTDKEL